MINIILGSIRTARSVKRKWNSFLYKKLFARSGKDVIVCGNAFIENPGLIYCGNKVVINQFCVFQAANGGKIEIGDNVTFSYGCKILTGGLQLPVDANRTHEYKSILIGSNVWIGANAIILPGVSIANNVIVAAGRVVSKDVESNTVVGGVPAKYIKHIERV